MNVDEQGRTGSSNGDLGLREEGLPGPRSSGGVSQELWYEQGDAAAWSVQVRGSTAVAALELFGSRGGRREARGENGRTPRSYL